ncbi:MAG: type III-B CRISPR module-associated protein Cmr3 [Proteobacteria bacterium]|nr:type III-B CRISPR module-associated protein Cmr3 [Pseudomonadota bacterium]
MTRVRRHLMPRDGLFLKDGRGWYTSDIGRSHSLTWPIPPTVRGALRAAYGHAWMARTGQKLCPEKWEERSAGVAIHALLTTRCPVGQTPSRCHRMWPVPADAVCLHLGSAPGTDRHRTQVVRLNPEEPRNSDVEHLDDALAETSPSAVQWASLWRPYLQPDKIADRPDFWPEETMMRWLRGDSVSISDASGYRLPRRVDFHVTIDPATQAATPTMLFSTELTEPLADRLGDCSADCDTSVPARAGPGERFVQWGMAVDFALPTGEHALPGDHSAFPGEPLAIGGQRRLAASEQAPDSLFSPPDDLGGDSPGLTLTLVTPAEFQNGWLPDGFAAAGPSGYCGTVAGIAVILQAAIVGRPLDLSSWDMVRGEPRKTRRLVRSGAVYFFRKDDDAPFTAGERRRLWLASLINPKQGNAGRVEDGLGRVVPGCWNGKGN